MKLSSVLALAVVGVAFTFALPVDETVNTASIIAGTEGKSLRRADALIKVFS